MKKLIVMICGAVLIASSVLGGAVTNTAKWNVPWGDTWKGRAQDTLDTYETEINSLSAGGSFGDVSVNNASVRTNLTVTNNIFARAGIYIVGSVSNTALTASKPVFTDGNKVLTSDGFRKIDSSYLPAATDGQIYVGATHYGAGGSNMVAKSITGGITITSNGVVTVTEAPLAAMTNASGFAIGTLFTGGWTNIGSGSTNIVQCVNGLVTTVSRDP